jgi:hypothetical protein
MNLSLCVKGKRVIISVIRIFVSFVVKNFEPIIFVRLLKWLGGHRFEFMAMRKSYIGTDTNKQCLGTHT